MSSKTTRKAPTTSSSDSSSSGGTVAHADGLGGVIWKELSAEDMAELQEVHGNQAVAEMAAEQGRGESEGEGTEGNQSSAETEDSASSDPGASDPDVGEDGFHKAWRSRDGKVKSYFGQEYETYKGALGETEATSETAGTPISEPLTSSELREIFDGVNADLEAGEVDPAVVKSMVEQLTFAFEAMKIDTVEAQASYLANAYVESDQFRYMTETQKAVDGNAAYETDPSQVALDEGWLNRAAAGQVSGVAGYEYGGSINPTGDWDDSFIGRGPIQVTHRHYYAQCLAVLEHRAEELEADDPESADAARIREAVDAIKADPSQAANPDYAFLFSAAFMKMADGRGVRGDEKAAQGQVTSWMGPQHADMKVVKETAYRRARDVLMRKATSEPATPTDAPSD